MRFGEDGEELVLQGVVEVEVFLWRFGGSCVTASLHRRSLLFGSFFLERRWKGWRRSGFERGKREMDIGFVFGQSVGGGRFCRDVKRRIRPRVVVKMTNGRAERPDAELEE